MPMEKPAAGDLAPSKAEVLPGDTRSSSPRDVRQSVPRDVRQSVPRDVRQSVPRAGVAQALGLHPLVAFGMFACDWMLFGGEAGSAGVGLAITIPIALALTIPSILVQRYSFKDGWGAAIGKGLLVGVLTAIPMPIGSPITFAGGVLGLLRPRAKALPPAARGPAE